MKIVKIGVVDRRPTRSRRSSAHERALLTVLGERNSFRSVRELHDELAQQGHSAGLVTVYRLLEAMARRGDVDSIRGERGEMRYRLSLSGGRHHHLLCRKCDDVVEIAGGELWDWASALASRHGFTEMTLQAAVVGTCRACHTEGQDTPPSTGGGR